MIHQTQTIQLLTQITNEIEVIGRAILELFTMEENKLHKASLPKIKEPWVRSCIFSQVTDICHPTSISSLIRKDPHFPTNIWKIEKNKIYVKQEALAEYFRDHGTSRLKNRSNKYFKNKEKNSCKTTAFHTLPSQPID